MCDRSSLLSLCYLGLGRNSVVEFPCSVKKALKGLATIWLLQKWKTESERNGVDLNLSLLYLKFDFQLIPSRCSLLTTLVAWKHFSLSLSRSHILSPNCILLTFTRRCFPEEGQFSCRPLEWTSFWVALLIELCNRLKSERRSLQRDLNQNFLTSSRKSRPSSKKRISN